MLVYLEKEQSWSIVEARYLTAYKPIMSSSGDFDKYQGFVQMLVNSGYKVTSKSMRRSGENWKGNCDIEITLAAVDAIRDGNIQWLVLMSNDSDFTELLKYAKHYGVKTAVATVDGATAFELKNEADIYLDLSEVEVFRQRVEG